jgi:hypothetical protein
MLVEITTATAFWKFGLCGALLPEPPFPGVIYHNYELTILTS